MATIFTHKQLGIHRLKHFLVVALAITLVLGGCARPVLIQAKQKSKPEFAKSGVRDPESGIEIVGDPEIIVPMNLDPAFKTKFFDYALRFPGLTFDADDITSLSRKVSIVVARLGDRAQISYLAHPANLVQADIAYYTNELRKIEAETTEIERRFELLGGSNALPRLKKELLATDALTTTTEALYIQKLSDLKLSSYEKSQFPDFVKLHDKWTTDSQRVKWLEAIADDQDEVAKKQARKKVLDAKDANALTKSEKLEKASLAARIEELQDNIKQNTSYVEIKDPTQAVGALGAARKKANEDKAKVMEFFQNQSAEVLKHLNDYSVNLTATARAAISHLEARQRRDEVARDVNLVEQHDNLVGHDQNGTIEKKRIVARITELKTLKDEKDDPLYKKKQYQNPDTVLIRILARDIEDSIGESIEIRAAFKNQQAKPLRFSVQVLQGIVKTKAFVLPRQQTAQLFGQAFADNFMTVRIEVANDGRYPVIIYGDSIEPPVTFSFTQRVNPSSLLSYMKENGVAWNFYPYEQAVNQVAYSMKSLPEDKRVALNSARERLRQTEENLALAKKNQYARQKELSALIRPTSSFESIVSPGQVQFDMNDQFPVLGANGLASARNAPPPGEAEFDARKEELEKNLDRLQSEVAAERRARDEALPTPFPSIDLDFGTRNLEMEGSLGQRPSRLLIRPRNPAITEADAASPETVDQIKAERMHKSLKGDFPSVTRDLEQLYPNAIDRVSRLQSLEELKLMNPLKYQQTSDGDRKVARKEDEVTSAQQKLSNLRSGLEELAKLSRNVTEAEYKRAEARRNWEITADDILIYQESQRSYLADINVVHEIQGNYQLWTADDILRVFAGIENERASTWGRKLLDFTSALLGGATAFTESASTLRGIGFTTGLVIPGTKALFVDDVATHLANLQDRSFKPVEEIKSGQSITRFGFLPRGLLEGLIGNDRLSPFRGLSWSEAASESRPEWFNGDIREGYNHASVPRRLNVQIQDVHSEQDVLVRGYVVFVTGAIGATSKSGEK